MKKTIISIMVIALAMTLIPINSINFVNAAQSQKVEYVSISEANQSARVSWRTAQAVTTKFYYGNSPSNYTTQIIDDYAKNYHMVTLRALDAGTPYYYKIVAGDVEKTGSFKTTGEKPQLTVYQNYFTLLFDDYWRNINGIDPTLISDADGLDFSNPGFTGGSLQINRQKSYLQYSCENNFNGGFGTVSAWVSFNNYDKSAVIWQTDDSRYVLYFEIGNKNRGFDKRIAARAGGNVDGEYPEAEYIIDPEGSALNKWGINEWHFVTMTWEGKVNGQVKLYIDGIKVDEAEYHDSAGCSTFRVGNSYRDIDNMNFSIGKIDELKIHQWAMHPYYVNQNYLAYNYSPNFNKKGSAAPQVAGISIRYFKNGKLLKDPNGKVYVISHDKRIHVSDLDALNRLRPARLISVTLEEINQYPDAGKFYSWSRYPHGTLLKAWNDDTVHYLAADEELHPILNEITFYKYGNEWNDVISVSQGEIDTYTLGSVSQ